MSQTERRLDGIERKFESRFDKFENKFDVALEKMGEVTRLQTKVETLERDVAAQAAEIEKERTDLEIKLGLVNASITATNNRVISLETHNKIIYAIVGLIGGPLAGWAVISLLGVPK